MSVFTDATVLAHTGGGETTSTGELAMTIILVTVLVGIWVLLGVVCWIFWRAKKRDDAAAEAGSRPVAQHVAPEPLNE